MKAKKILASILSLAMVLGSISLTALADDAVNVAKIGDEGYTSLEAAFAAAGESDTITLLADATPELTSQHAITKAAVIDLNDKTLTLTEDDLYFGTTTFKKGKIVVDSSVCASTAVFWMFENQTLIFDDVDIIATGVTGTYLIGINAGTGSEVKLLNSSITIKNTDTASLTAVIADNGTGNSVVIENSEFDVEKIEGRFYLGGTGGSITVKDSDIDLNGVKEGFYLRAGQTLSIEGDSTVDITLNSNEDRYGINVTDDTATYIKDGGATVNATDNAPAPVEVSTYDELVVALKKDNANIIMTADITGTATTGGYSVAGIVLEAGDVLDGNGHKLTINGANSTWDCAIAMTGGTVKNLTIAGAMRGVFMPGANGNVVIDTCVFEDVIYTFNSDAGSKDYSVTIKNTTLNGWTSFSNVHKSVIFEDCTFGEGSGYAYCRPYQPTTFTGCDFNEGFELDTTPTQTADGALKFNGCTYAGEALSAENAAPLFSDGGTVVIDNEKVVFDKYVPPVAQIGDNKYTSLQSAIDEAQDGEITLLADVTENITVADGVNIVLDLNGNTLTGHIAPCEPETLAVKNGSIVNTDSGVSAVEINKGNLTLTDVNIESARHAVRIDGEVTAVIDGGTYKTTVIEAGKTQHALNVSGNANVTIKDGTFTGPNGTTADSGSAVNAQAGSTVTIEGGTFTGGKNHTLSAAGTLTVKGGTFDQDPTACLADGYVIDKNTDGTYGVSLSLPTADVTDIPQTELEEKGAPPLTFALKFAAVEPTEAQLEKYKDWYADFELTVNKKAVFNANLGEGVDGYLAGQYSAWSESWVSVPFEDVTLEAGDSLKIMEYAASLMGEPGLKITYNDVVEFVKIFNCGIYFTDEFIAENPDLEVTLSLNMYNPEDETEKYTIGDTYKFSPVTCEWIAVTDSGYYMNGTNKEGLMRWLFLASINGTADAVGIEYQGSTQNTQVLCDTVITDGNVVFYGDVNGFTETEATKDTYSARGFVKSGSTTNYSDIVTNAPNWDRELDYKGGNE